MGISIVSVFAIHYAFTLAVVQFFVSCVSSVLIVGGLYWFIGLDKDEKLYVKKIIKKKVFKKHELEETTTDTQDI